jgi:hypothetical protein
MKANHLFSYAILFTIVTFACNKNSEIGPSTKIELFNNTSNSLIGSSITKVIGVAGGSINLPSAGANVIVPAGAMADGASITVQAISDVLDNEGQGIQITGDWSKPITLEFAYGPDETSPENKMIAYKTPKGNWITSRKVKVNYDKSTYAIRLGQTNSTNAKLNALKTTAKTYSFAASNDFYIKPNQSKVNAGESVSFTAYARQGDTDGYWRKRKDGTFVYDDGELVPLTKPADTQNAKIDDDDELVPLIQTPKTTTPGNDDDELVPLTAVIKEAPFTNKKEGFTRSWSIEGVGSIGESGNIGAKYTAPNDPSVKGKLVKVKFTSKNNKTGQPIEATAKVTINDGLTRYIGNITMTETRNYSTGGGTTMIEETKYASGVILTNSSVITVYSSKIVKTNENNINTIIDSYSKIESDGGFKVDLLGSCRAEGYKAGVVYLDFKKDGKTYSISGWLSNETNECEVNTFCDNCFPKNTKSKTSFYGHLDSDRTIIGEYTDPKTIADSKTFTKTVNKNTTTAKISWNFVRQD